MRLICAAATLAIAMGCGETERPVGGPGTTGNGGRLDARQERPARKRVFFSAEPAPQAVVREAYAAAEGWYPRDAKRLMEVVEEHLRKGAGVKEKDAVMLVAPHAGMMFCGKVAGHAYAPLEGAQYDLVVILGTGHGGRSSVCLVDAYRQPWGDVPVDRELAEKISKELGIGYHPELHKVEHAVEMQLPFLCAVLKDFKMVAVLISDDMAGKGEALGAKLAALLKDRKALIVVSTDMSHYLNAKEATEADREFLKEMETLDAGRIREKRRRLLAAYERPAPPGQAAPKAGPCGFEALLAGLSAAKALGGKRWALLKYANSYDTTGTGRERVVGYAAAMILK